LGLSSESSLPQEPRLPSLSTQARQQAVITAREFTIPQGPGSAAHIPLLKRAVVLALNWHAGLSFDAIAIKLNINAQMARRIVNWAKV